MLLNADCQYVHSGSSSLRYAEPACSVLQDWGLHGCWTGYEDNALLCIFLSFQIFWGYASCHEEARHVDFPQPPMLMCRG